MVHSIKTLGGNSCFIQKPFAVILQEMRLGRERVLVRAWRGQLCYKLMNVGLHGLVKTLPRGNDTRFYLFQDICKNSSAFIKKIRANFILLISEVYFQCPPS